MVNMKRFLIGAILIAMLSAVGCSSSKPSEKLSEAASEHRTQAQSENNKETQQATIEQTAEPTTAQIVKPTAAPIELPTEKVTIPDVNFSAMDEEKGAYWLVNKIKSLGTSGGNYVSSFGTTTYTLIAAYIAANPNSRFDASLKAVLAKAKEIYTVELQLKKLDDKYDYPIAKMYEYSVDSKNMSFEVEAQYTESYASGVLGWLDKQYDSFKNVGKRTTYYATLADGSKALVRPANKFSDKGSYNLCVACVDTVTVTVDGFEKKFPVYYEITPELKASITNDYNDSLQQLALFDSKKSELNNLLNNIE